MRSTTPERLATCRSVRDHTPAETQALLGAVDRVYSMRARLATVLWKKKKWTMQKAVYFAYNNGRFWS